MTRLFFLSCQWIFLFLLFNPYVLLLLNSIYNAYDLQRILELVILGWTTLHLLYDLEFRQQVIGILERFCTYKKGLLFGFFILGLISAVHAAFPTYALMQVATFFVLFIFMLSLAGFYTLEPERFLKQFEFFILFTFTVNAGIALFAMTYAKLHPALLSAGNIQSGMLANFLASPGYINRRFFDDGQVFLIPILLGLFFLKSTCSWKKGLIFLLLSFCFARGFLDGSRIYFVEPVLLILILPCLFRKKAWPFLGLMVATFIAGIVLYYALYKWNFDFSAGLDPNGGLGVPAGRTFLNNRGLLWQIALHLIRAHPLLGVGPLHYGVYAYSTEGYAAHPHSVILMLASEWGLPALILLMILVIGALAYFCCKMREPTSTKDENAMRLGITGALIGGLTMMQIDGLALMPVGQIMLALVSGLALGLVYGPARPDTFVFTSSRFRFYVLFAAVSALVLIAYALFPIIAALPDLSIGYLINCSFNCALSPDYWSQGFIQFYQLKTQLPG